MAGRPSLIRTVDLHVCLPEDIYARLVIHLYSSAEGRVPRGAFQRFFNERITEFFAAKGDSNAKS